MSPLQAVAVENRLTRLRKKVCCWIANTNRHQLQRKNIDAESRREARTKAFAKVLEAIDTELAEVRT